MQKVTTFLMFTGKAEEAIKVYTSSFENSEIVSITRYGDNKTGVKGTVEHATFTINGQEFMAIDSSIEHGFTFTPAMSLFVTCETEPEIDALFQQLSAGGKVPMPLAEYPFSAKFGWVEDRFGVSWQLSLPLKL